MGQALDIPVYYKHERFDAIIGFPPMPVALDFSIWQRASGMLMALNKPGAAEPYEHFQEDWDERFEPLVNREDIDGKSYLELSATGQIFHETFRSRFQQLKDAGLPRPAANTEKRRPNLGQHSYQQAREPILRFLEKLGDEVPYVRFCHTIYWNPDLSQTPRFRLQDDVVNCRASLAPEMAIRLDLAFGGHAQQWYALLANYDVANVAMERAHKIKVRRLWRQNPETREPILLGAPDQGPSPTGRPRPAAQGCRVIRAGASRNAGPLLQTVRFSRLGDAIRNAGKFISGIAGNC